MRLSDIKIRATPGTYPDTAHVLFVKRLVHFFSQVMQALVMLLSGDCAMLPDGIQHLLLTEKELVVFLNIAQSGPGVVVMVYVHDTLDSQKNRAQSSAQRCGL